MSIVPENIKKEGLAGMEEEKIFKLLESVYNLRLDLNDNGLIKVIQEGNGVGAYTFQKGNFILTCFRNKKLFLVYYTLSLSYICEGITVKMNDEKQVKKFIESTMPELLALLNERKERAVRIAKERTTIKERLKKEMEIKANAELENLFLNHDNIKK